MDLFQLLINLEFIDPKKLITKTLQPWGWDLESLMAEAQQPGMGAVGPDGQPLPPGAGQMVGPDGQPIPGGMPPSPQMGPAPLSLSGVSPDIAQQTMAMLGTPGVKFAGASPFAEANSPINLLAAGAMPPTVKGAPGTVPGRGGTGRGGAGPAQRQKGNPRGHNRGGKVNTAGTKMNSRNNSSPESALLNRTFNLQ